jgi:hypothetical protein
MALDRTRAVAVLYAGILRLLGGGVDPKLGDPSPSPSVCSAFSRAGGQDPEVVVLDEELRVQDVGDVGYSLGFCKSCQW